MSTDDKFCDAASASATDNAEACETIKAACFEDVIKAAVRYYELVIGTTCNDATNFAFDTAEAAALGDFQNTLQMSESCVAFEAACPGTTAAISDGISIN